uniref:Pseudouridine synthase RsuA/RluA-like domain-containing protein n=1 Tax=Pseudo-nitzschia australis TaxID=44445 RepID=A0A7S4A9Z9_9STRA|mmetsp:Transcript_17745/g.38766  ORF Transcript_17745/g.38766 Transcript_17745/m.38766 type:complete len:572 (-) Transcript_17745:102-1817(-)
MFRQIAFKEKGQRMKQISFFGLLLLLCRIDPTNAFRQSFCRRQLAFRQPSLLTKPLSKNQIDVEPRKFVVSALRNRNRWTQKYSSSTDYYSEVDDHIVADEDANDEEGARSYDQSEIDKFFDEAERDANRMNFPRGKPEGYYVTKQYSILETGFGDSLVIAGANGSGDNEARAKGITQAEINRLGINGKNITLPIALMLLDKEAYPSLSRARKSCRKGHIVVNRGPLIMNGDTGKEEFDQDTCFKGRVIDRVYPGDVIGIQCRMNGGFYPGFDTTKPSFELPVLYEDSHFAIVNKPAGIVCYSLRDDNHGGRNIRNALPFVLKPPKRGTFDIYLRPAGVHRLDKPTSGLLIVAKTRPAMVDLSKQFAERRVKKTYTAIVNGIPEEPVETSITSEQATKLGVDVGSIQGDTQCNWQLIDHVLDEKSAITVWKPLGYTNSIKAKDGTLTLVELKPKTGRFHQLRRHMAWVRECPLVGDVTYDGGGDAMNLRGRGLFLCSNRVRLEHPYYNTVKGRTEWETLPNNEKWANGTLALSEDGTTVEVRVSIDLPNKFQGFLATERKRYEKFENSDKS